MAFVEHSVASSVNAIRTIFVDAFDFIPDTEDETKFWCDETKTIGVRIYKKEAYTTTYLAICTSDAEYATDIDFISDSVVYYQLSKDKDVKYIRCQTGSTNRTVPRIIFAKSDVGDWCVFYNDQMYHKNGHMYIGEHKKITNADTPFSVHNMPNLVAGGTFPNLYKVDTATTFTIGGTYVDFGGEAYRMVNTQHSTIGYATDPDYAYPVADETS